MQDTGNIKMSWREADGLGKKKSLLWETVIKKTVKCHFTNIKWQKFKNFGNSKCW